MRLFFQILTFIMAGTGLGYCTADYAMTTGLQTVALENGPWKTWPAVAQPTADPYTRAHFAKSGKLMVTLFEAITFRATKDGDGRALDGSCDYKVTGAAPPAARWWSISLYDDDGRLVNTPAKRHSFNSSNTVRRTDGSFDVNISHRISPGNWLPADDGEKFVLLLRIYNADQEITTDPAHAELPRVIRGECR